jgi:hypothetical protein
MITDNPAGTRTWFPNINNNNNNNNSTVAAGGSDSSSYNISSCSLKIMVILPDGTLNQPAAHLIRKAL